MKRTAFEVIADAMRYLYRLEVAAHPERSEQELTVADIARAADRTPERVREVLGMDYGIIGLRIAAQVRWWPEEDRVQVLEAGAMG